ncbi:hypothetical protein BHE90_004919 [Fusarium euwallaceae]|uniref:PD-(D/E)XK nuclease-like domain-containing protein n=1 Tax=Fusarium euwallaceae TaxID=1147111 RepID=A0A430LY63_9HYPO|nr:hypothetical protein BHE90_004919 [Fusarium euwallaceae]
MRSCQRPRSIRSSEHLKSILDMSDRNAANEPRRSERVKAIQTPRKATQSLPVRPSQESTGSPVKWASRKVAVNDATSTSDGDAWASSDSSRADPEATPRATREANNRASPSAMATSVQYSKNLSNYQTIFDKPSLPSSRSSRSQSSASKRSTSPVKNIASLHEAGIVYYDLNDNGVLLGEAGDELRQDLTDVAMLVGIYPAPISKDIHIAIEHKHRIHQHHNNMNDSRPREDLLDELSKLQEIKRLSVRCTRYMEGEAEWNNSVHSAVLRLAFGHDDSEIGWRYITNAKIDPQYLPKMSDGLTSSSKMVDYALFIGDRQGDQPEDVSTTQMSHLDQMISKFITAGSDSINHIPYFALRHHPIFLGIETKTISRTEEEALVQLGIWVTAQVRRIWFLGHRASASKAVALRDVLKEMVFPLIFVQAAKWRFLFARPFFKLDVEGREVLHMVIYQDISLGETSSIEGLYQLLQAFRIIRKWGDDVFRGWWKRILEIIDEGD